MVAGFPIFRLTNKKGLQYRYYQRKEKVSADDVLYRLPAHEIESRVEDGVRQGLSDFDKASSLLALDASSQADLVRLVNERQRMVARQSHLRRS